MIRDPSDGSVRETTDRFGVCTSEVIISHNDLGNILHSATSGLPLESTKPERQARLEKSRRELENYRKTGLFQGTTADPSIAVRSSKTEGIGTMGEGFKIARQPEYDALNAFDAENNVEPARTIAERIAWKYNILPAHAIVDDISHAIEDAIDLGVRRGPLIPKPKELKDYFKRNPEQGT